MNPQPAAAIPLRRQHFTGYAPRLSTSPFRAFCPAASISAGALARSIPRVCGGTLRHDWNDAIATGLSPRVRGNRTQPQRGNESLRSIPACAGEPAVARRRMCPRKVYPRVCGGTLATRAEDRGGRAVYPRVCGGTGYYGTAARCSLGLSPRVRGNRRQPGGLQPPLRSIPACAGEPVT